MSIKLIISLILLVSLGGIGGFGFYKLNGLQDISTEKSNEDPIPTTYGFDIPIHVLVANPSKTTIPIRSVNYVGILESTGEILAQGSINDIRIKREASTWINTSAAVTWTKTLTTTLELVKQDHVWVNVNLDINMFGLYNFPYSTKVDIKEALQSKINTGTLPADTITPINNVTQNGSLLPRVL